MDCGCAQDGLCNGCLEALWMQLKGVAACRGDTWCNQLSQARREPWVPWPSNSARVRAVAMTWVDDLTRDVRLREKLAAEIERCAAERWQEQRPLVTHTAHGT